VDTPVQLKPGDEFAGDFRVLRPLNAGGMGAVYLVEQISTSKKRALKVMLPSLVQQPGMRERFELEAKVGGSIDSDHVVEVIGAGVDAEGIPWIAMELLEGEDLESLLGRKGRLPPSAVLSIMEQLCHAMGEAHRRSIVHRDIKPENVFLARQRRKRAPPLVKVLDFGIAKIVAEAAAYTTGDIGSFLWMAPEQARGTGITPATDVWALGLLAFRMLTGRVFWRTAYAPDRSLIMYYSEAFMDAIPPASTRAEEYGCAHLLPPGFDAWFARCAVREADARWADATEAYEALEPVLGVRGASPDSEREGLDFGPTESQESPDASAPSSGAAPRPPRVATLRGVKQATGVRKTGSTAPAPIAQLRIRIGDPPRTVHLRLSSSVGRHADNAVQIVDKSVSKKHCVIEARGGAWYLRDLDSTNGTFVNKVRVRGEVLLSDGDDIKIGNVPCRFELQTAAISPLGG
jgi:serine/threonine-protein kinase